MLSDEISVLEPLKIPVPSVENDSDMNPNAVICAEPLIVPSGVLSQKENRKTAFRWR